MRFTGLNTNQLLRDPSQQLAYGYVSGNPLAWADPFGLCSPEFYGREPTNSYLSGGTLVETYSNGTVKHDGMDAYRAAELNGYTGKDLAQDFADGFGNVGSGLSTVGTAIIRVNPILGAGVTAIGTTLTGVKYGLELATTDNITKEYVGIVASEVVSEVILKKPISSGVEAVIKSTGKKVVADVALDRGAQEAGSITRGAFSDEE